MPLCPQITMTPIPVADGDTGITMSWVKPVVFPTTATAASIVGTLYHPTAPVAYTVGQLWANSADGNKLYRCSSVATITNAVGSAGTVTYTTDAPHGFTAGQLISIAEVDPTAYNLTGVTVASAPTTTSFTVTNGATGTYVDGGWAAGWTVVQDTSIATAQTTATNAQTTATNAQTTANTAQTTASTAQTKANDAYTLADSAYTLAGSKISIGYGVDDVNSALAAAVKSIKSSTSSTRVELSNGGLILYKAGSPMVTLDASTGNASFSGTVYASSGLIGNLLVNSTSISTAASGSRVVFDSNGVYAYNSGGTATVQIKASDGSITASNMNITGGPSGGDVINIATGTFKVTSTGAVTATSATITGDITATSGKLGNWTVTGGDYLVGTDGTALYATKSSGYSIVASGIVKSNDKFEVVGSSNVFNTTGTTDAGFNIGGSAGTVNAKWVPATDNTYSLGGSATTRRWTVVYATTGTINTSDAREKTDVTDETLGLDFITRLRPVGFRYIVGNNDVEKQYDDEGRIIGETVTPRPGIRRHHGFLAQDVKATLDEMQAEDFSGWTIADPNDPESLQGLRYEAFIAPLTKAVQELAAKVAERDARITQLEAAQAALESRLAALEARP